MNVQKKSWRWAALLPLGLVAGMATFVAIGCDTEKPAKVKTDLIEVSTPNSQLEECGIQSKDCAHVDLQNEKIVGKNKAASVADEKVLDCSGKRASRNADGTWDVCKCPCVLKSQIAAK